MGVATMGKVLVPAKIENLSDVYDAEQGRLSADNVRSVDVPDALVDTGASGLSMPLRLIQQLGLRPLRTRRIRTAGGSIDAQMYGAVRLSVQDRFCFCDVLEVPADCPVLIGQVPLEAMDFVVDPIKQRLIGNPEHNGEWMSDVF